VGETLALVTSSWSRTTDMISEILTERETTGLTDEAVAGFLGAFEKQPHLQINLETIDQLSTSAADSEEVQAILARINKRYNR
jgi:hypothetical protein